MTTTEELRHLLDERGVKWTSERVIDGVLFTFAKDGRTYSVFARDRAGLEMWSKYLTPEQAIAATLGPWECRITDNGPWGYPYVCSACGASFDQDVNNGEFNYCPNCGRKVVDE